MEKQNLKLQEYIKFLDFNETIILRDEMTGANLNVKLDINFYHGNTHIDQLARLFAERLDVIKVDSKNHVTVDLYGLFNNENFIKYAGNSISNVYVLIDDYEEATFKLTHDVAHYLNVGADKFCSRILECFDYMDGTKEFNKIINSLKTTPEITGEFVNSYKIPVVFQSSGYIEVKSNSLEDAVKYAEKHIDEFKLPENPQYIEDSFEIDYGSIEGLKVNVASKGQSLDKRIAEADKKKFAVRESKNTNNEILR